MSDTEERSVRDRLAEAIWHADAKRYQQWRDVKGMKLMAYIGDAERLLASIAANPHLRLAIASLPEVAAERSIPTVGLKIGTADNG